MKKLTKAQVKELREVLDDCGFNAWIDEGGKIESLDSFHPIAVAHNLAQLARENLATILNSYPELDGWDEI